LKESERIAYAITFVKDKANSVVFLDLVDTCAFLETHSELAVLEENQEFGIS
jgi:hypothetical protein